MLGFHKLLRLRSPLFSPSLPLPFSKTLSSSSPGPGRSSQSQPPAVAVFWDLDNNKPPKSIPPYDAAVRLRLAASSFGLLRSTVAYANRHVLQSSSGAALASAAAVPYICRICGRNFYDHSKLINHFKQIHEREQTKRLSRINSSRGARRVQLAAKLAMKMDKYKKVASEILAPLPKEKGYGGLAEELKRAGVLVRTVESAAYRARIKEHMVDEMGKGRIGCLVLVSDDSRLVGVLREAQMRCLMTVVIGDEGDGPLKRCADAVFSWKDVASGKARKAAGSAVGKWKDKDLLKRLEWRYEPEDCEEESEDGDDGSDDGGLTLVGVEGNEPWWKLDPDHEAQHSQVHPS